jgi:REP element-mobilizing transposase RayT
MNIKEKNHRLPKEFYKGEISVAFTLCLKGNEAAGFAQREPKGVAAGFAQREPKGVAAGFSLRETEIVSTFTDILASVVENTECMVPVYCFMPDHQHLIITGVQSNSDIWKTIISYKQKTGFWMSKNKSDMEWQKDFYDHVIRRHEDLAIQIKYILDNPVRKGLVSLWQEYPYKGSVGCKLEDVLCGIV